MDHDMGVCSIGYGELTAILLFPQQREHAVRPAPACGMDDQQVPDVALR